MDETVAVTETPKGRKGRLAYDKRYLATLLKDGNKIIVSLAYNTARELVCRRASDSVVLFKGEDFREIVKLARAKGQNICGVTEAPKAA